MRCGWRWIALIWFVHGLSKRHYIDWAPHAWFLIVDRLASQVGVIASVAAMSASLVSSLIVGQLG